MNEELRGTIGAILQSGKVDKVGELMLLIKQELWNLQEELQNAELKNGNYTEEMDQLIDKYIMEL